MKKVILIITLMAAPFCLAEGKGKNGKRAALKAFITERFDTDGDGALNETEKEAAKAQREARREEISALRNSYDVNGDGQLDDTEKEAFRAVMEEKIIANFDRDGDGVLNETEQAALDAVKEARKGHCKKGGKGARRNGGGEGI